MIYIEKGERIALPPKFRNINNVCAIVYDMLTEVFVDEIYSALRNTTVQLNKKVHEESLWKSKKNIIDFLSDNGYTKELEEVLIKHITLSILSDMVNFIYESLSCAKKGKISVAYALLRKPFKDELLLLEAILTNPTTFIKEFFHDGDPKLFDPSKWDNDKKAKILKAACKKVQPSIFSADLLYEFRYDKTSNLGLSGLSDHALHIVTSNPNYPTERQNFNFIFSISEDVHDYWVHYYRILPYLLLYSASVVDAIIFPFLSAKEAEHYYSTKVFKRLIGFYLWLNKSPDNANKTPRVFFKLIKDVLVRECPNCKHKKKIRKSDIQLYFKMNILICDNCYKQIDLNETTFS